MRAAESHGVRTVGAETFRCGHCQAELTAPAEPIQVNDESHFAAVTGRSALPVLVDFWAAWCSPCKMVAPELAKAAAIEAGRWLVVKVNSEELPSVAQRFGIASIPTLVPQRKRLLRISITLL